MTVLVLALRGAAAIAILTTLVGGIPRLAQACLAATIGLWSAMMVLPGAAVAPSWIAAIHELVIGATLGVVAAVPLLAAQSAGRIVDLAGSRRSQGPYGLLFGVLAAAVFVGINGHVAVMRTIVESHRAIPGLVGDPDAFGSRATVLASLAKLIPAAIRLAAPWLVTAAVVEIAVGVGVRVASRSSAHVPTTAAVPAALVMMTASLVATLAITMAAIMRGAV